MTQKLSFVAFILGLVMVISSFTLRQSYEKEMYQLYINEQKGNLLTGWNKNWHDFLIENYDITLDPRAITVEVDRNGKLIDESFFPARSYDRANWQNFDSLSLSNQESFLVSQLNNRNSWDRAIAIKKLSSGEYDFSANNLTLYEQTLIDSNIYKSVSLIFDQINKKFDYSSISTALSFDIVLMRSSSNGVISLIVPSRDYLKNYLLLRFKSQVRVEEIELSDNYFFIKLKSDFNPFKYKSFRDKVLMFSGVVILLLGICLYFIELRNRRSEVLKKVSFLNQLVHEIKTPITGIKLNSELLLRNGHDEELVVALMNSSKRLNDFFEDIVLINKKSNALFLTDMSEEQFKVYLDDILHEFGIKIQFDFSVDRSVSLDKGRVRVILRNLFKNAIRYGKRASFVVYVDDMDLVLRVKDDGPGVALKDSDKIFSEFYRAESAKNSSPDGLGIGLSIVNSLAEQMNTQVRLVNPGEVNAIFEMRIKYGP